MIAYSDYWDVEECRNTEQCEVLIEAMMLGGVAATYYVITKEGLASTRRAARMCNFTISTECYTQTRHSQQSVLVTVSAPQAASH